VSHSRRIAASTALRPFSKWSPNLRRRGRRGPWCAEHWVAINSIHVPIVTDQGRKETELQMSCPKFTGTYGDLRRPAFKICTWDPSNHSDHGKELSRTPGRSSMAQARHVSRASARAVMKGGSAVERGDRRECDTRFDERFQTELAAICLRLFTARRRTSFTASTGAAVRPRLSYSR